MPRPRKPAKIDSLWSALTEDQLRASELALPMRALAHLPEVKAMVTVLVNERPSARGERDASFILGYEACLARFLSLLQMEQPRDESLPEPNYSSPMLEHELAWEKPAQKE